MKEYAYKVIDLDKLEAIGSGTVEAETVSQANQFICNRHALQRVGNKFLRDDVYYFVDLQEFTETKAA